MVFSLVCHALHMLAELRREIQTLQRKVHPVCSKERIQITF